MQSQTNGGAVIDIASRRVVAPPVIPDSEVEDVIYEKMVAILDEYMPLFSETSRAKPHLERARQSMTRQMAAHQR